MNIARVVHFNPSGVLIAMCPRNNAAAAGMPAGTYGEENFLHFSAARQNRAALKQLFLRTEGCCLFKALSAIPPALPTEL
jgi:hypothetical protein